MKANEIDARETGCREPRTNERGSAIVLTLGVLALLLITATVFIFTANTEREAAAVGADVAKARLMAKGKIEQAMALIYYASMNYKAAEGIHLPYPGTSRMAPGSSGSGWENIWHLASAWSTTYSADLSDQFYVDLGFDYTPATTAGMAGNPSWQTYSDSSGALIGRATYLLIDESGKLDPNGLINPDGEPYFDLNGNSTYQVGEPYYDWDGTGTRTVTAVAEGLEKRHGYLPAEIDLAAGVLGSDNLNVAAATTTAVDFSDRRHGTIRKWLSWQQMYKADYGGPLIAKTSGSRDADVRAMKDCLFPRSYDKEAFHAGGVDYQRFSVGTFDWGFPGIPLTAPDYGPEYTARVDSLIAAASVWDGAAASTAIPWLASLTGDGTIPNADLRRQVAANLVDYCDDDDGDGNPATDTPAATTDFSGPDYTDTTVDIANGDYGLASGTHCGLEMTAYLNEIDISVVEAHGSDALSTPPNDYEFTVEVELVNPYPIGRNGYQIDLHIQFSGLVATNPPIALPIVAATNSGMHLRWTGINCGANSYSAGGVARALFTYSMIGVSPSTINITGVAATLRLGGHIVDAAIANSSHPATMRSKTIGLGVPASFNFAADDPRCNLHPEYWHYGSVNSLPGSPLPGSPRNVQPIVPSEGDPSSARLAAGYNDARDTEVINDVALGISTAYIRNGPMMSLWELGAIHRGEPYRTLNLQAFSSGGAATGYANGDALLLDQCCVGPENYATGRFNPNSPVVPAWYAMLSKIAVGTKYGHTAGGVALTPAEIDAAGVAIIAVPGGGNPFDSRGRIAGVAALHTLSVLQTTDATREEIIGKIANLLTSRQNFFRILVTAQAVKDLTELGTLPDSMANRPSNWSKLADGHWVDVLAEVKQMAIVYRDAHNNTFEVKEVTNLE